MDKYDLFLDSVIKLQDYRATLDSNLSSRSTVNCTQRYSNYT